MERRGTLSNQAGEKLDAGGERSVRQGRAERRGGGGLEEARAWRGTLFEILFM